MMETVEKYKQTDFGNIPFDWSVVRIQDLIDDNVITSHLDGNHGELYPRSNEFKPSGVPYVGANDFYNGEVNFANCKFLSEERAKQFKKGIAKNGDVLFAHNATVGPVAFLKTDLDYIILSTTATYFRCDTNKLNNHFLLYTLQAPFFVKQYTSVMAQSTRFQVPITAQRKFYLILPSKAEQAAIATALSDTDALISSLEKLIAKKRNIKQGAMQQLFETGNLQELRLDDIVVIKKGEQLNKSDMSEKGTYPALNGGIEPSGYTDKWNTEKDTITISEGGNSCGFVNFSTERFWLGGHCYAVELIDAKFPKIYLYQYLKYSQKQIMELRVGSGLPNIQKTALNNFKIKIHQSHDEKIKVANCLNDMDAEINALETKLEKYRKVKLGMMQNLLTGKIRLI